MSGFCGIVSTGDIAAGASGRMAAALAHRGGVLHAARELPSGGPAPALFDGRLRNRPALAVRCMAGPERPPEEDDDEDDGELVRLLLRRAGDDFPGLLDGPFALAVFEEDGLFLARDPLGQRPLYWCLDGATFYFASEMKALLPLLRTAPGVDEQGLEEAFVLSDHLLAGSTLFRGVHRLRPGHSCRVTRRGAGLSVELRAYGPGPAAAFDARSEEGRRALRDLVERNVAEVAAGAASLGVLLSGGFDSSVLAALAVRHSRGRVQTFTIAGRPDFPDAVAARRVARHLGTDHHEILVGGPPDLAALRDGIHAYEDIFYRDVLYLLARRTRGLADVVLSGSGADLFGMPILARQGRLQAVLASWRTLAARLGPAAGERRIGRFMAQLEKELAEDDAGAVFRHFTGEYIPGQLLPSTEKAMSSVGIETSFPFADPALLLSSAALPAAQKYRGEEEEKPALRAAFADSGIPPEILARPKLCSKANLLEGKIALRNQAERALSDEDFARRSRGGLLTSKFQIVCLDHLAELRSYTKVGIDNPGGPGDTP